MHRYSSESFSVSFLFIKGFSLDIFDVNQERGLELVRVLLEQVLFAVVIVHFIWRSALSWNGVIAGLCLGCTQPNTRTCADNDPMSNNISDKSDI